MIRDKNNEYGEVNAFNTVLTSEVLTINKYIVSEGPTRIKPLNVGVKRLMTTDENGNASSVSYNVTNGRVITDNNGRLQVIRKLTLPDVPPVGRLLIAEVKGSTTGTGNLGLQTLTLEAPYWYEVEVLGAGGGAGSGAIQKLNASNFIAVNGTNGGDGGYYKGVFSVSTNSLATLQAGCPGQSSWGWQSYKDGKSIKVSGTGLGGVGGRSPILYSGTGNPGTFGGHVGSPSGGGLGINGGANGGNIAGDDNGSAGGGGGANGPYGGAGGSSISNVYYSGGGGGAGGGFGLAGAGGIVGQSNQPNALGGGAGGNGTLFGDTFVWESAGGGGGGGGSRFICNDFEVLCGGGGGGAGGFGGGYSGSYNTAGGHGKNNKNANIGGGSQGGVGGPSINTRDIDYETNTFGSTGKPGIVRIWRCV